MAGKNFPDLVRNRAIGIEAGLDEDEAGAQPRGSDGGHRRFDPKAPRLIACRSYYPALR